MYNFTFEQILIMACADFVDLFFNADPDGAAGVRLVMVGSCRDDGDR
jgi:hypothetical protein